MAGDKDPVTGKFQIISRSNKLQTSANYAMPKTKAAAVQLNSQPDSVKSLDEAYTLVKQAAEAGAVLICLPENFAFLGDERQKLEQSTEISAMVENRLPRWAREYGVTILGGGYPAAAGNGKIYNRSIIVDPNGDVAASYDKIHLFDVDISEDETWRESATVQPGRYKAVVYRSGKLPTMGLSICYDLRFPELYRLMALEGVDIITVPSAFTRPTGEAHWETLLRARAIENSAYVIAPAQTGLHGEKRKTWGHSLIIDPWGKVLADAGSEPGIIYADIDTDYLNEIRKKLPSLKHRVL
jgi:deaminated glutathione amidase